jgi:hypothetical protein
MHALVALFMAGMGVAIAVIWSLDIVRGRGFDRSLGLSRARELGSGNLMLPHWVAESSTAVALLLGALAILLDWAVAVPVACVALGALVYTSLNSLGWALATPVRMPYAIPMAVGAIGGWLSIVFLVLL